MGGENLFSDKPKIKKYEIVQTRKQLFRLRNTMMHLSEAAVDTETNTLRANGPNKDFRCVGISISWGEYNNYYIPLGHEREEDMYSNAELEDVVEALTPVFEREDITLVFHNYHFDAHVFDRIGIRIKSKNIFDTQVASFLIDENEDNKLKNNTKRYLGIDQTHFNDATATVPKEVRKEYGLKSNSKAPFSLVLIKDGAPYALDDAFYTWELYLGFEPLLQDEGMHKIYWKHYVPFIDCMLTVERNGVTIDTEKLEKMREEIKIDCENLKCKLFDIAGVEFNPGSPQQKAELLFGYRKPDNVNKKTGKVTKANINEHLIDVNFGFKPISRTKTGNPSTDADTFWELSLMKNAKGRKAEGVEFCKVMSEYSKLEKLRGAFIEGTLENMYDDGKIHCNYNITGATSGRLSCSNLNLQQLPKAGDEDKYQIRSLFIGDKLPDGSREKILALDYANLEMRLLTHYSIDSNLMRMFLDGEDSHGSTAVNMFELDCEASEAKKKYPHLRQAAKTINFLLMYGGGATTLYEKLRKDHDAPIDLSDKHYLDQYKVRKGKDVAQIYIDKYFKSYSGVAEFIKKQKRLAHKQGYVTTLMGRKRRLPMINSSDHGEVAYGERLATNSTIQGCISGDTLILTEGSGVKRISDLSNHSVSVWDGKKFSKALVLPSGEKEECELKLEGNNTIYCSPNHRFLTINTKKNLIWKTVDEFSSQEYLVMSDEAPSWSAPLVLPDVEEGKAPNSRNLSMSRIEDPYDRGVLTGHIAGDGSVTRGSVYCLVAEHEYAILPEIERLFSYFGRYSKDESKGGKGDKKLTRLSIKSKRLCNELIACGIKSRIPDFIWSDKESLRGYLRGKFDSDGTVNVNGVTLTFGRVHEKELWARDIQQALYLFGIHSRLVYCADRINVCVMKKHVPLFRERIGFLNPLKQEKLSKFKSSQKYTTFGRDVVKVKSVSRTGNFIEMFDVVNSDSHKFLANGIVTHNSAADVMSSAQILIHNNQRLKELGVHMIMQIHDEVVFRCPEAAIEEATVIIGNLMLNMFGKKTSMLRLPIPAESDSGNSYAEAK